MSPKTTTVAEFGDMTIVASVDRDLHACYIVYIDPISGQPFLAGVKPRPTTNTALHIILML